MRFEINFRFYKIDWISLALISSLTIGISGCHMSCSVSYIFKFLTFLQLDFSIQCVFLNILSMKKWYLYILVYYLVYMMYKCKSLKKVTSIGSVNIFSIGDTCTLVIGSCHENLLTFPVCVVQLARVYTPCWTNKYRWNLATCILYVNQVVNKNVQVVFLII